MSKPISDMTWDEAKTTGATYPAWLMAMSLRWPARSKPQSAQMKTSRPLIKVKAESIMWPCAHRGAEAGETSCTSCGSQKVALKIFACAKHGECTIQKLGDKIGPACCRVCKDREPIEPKLVEVANG